MMLKASRFVLRAGFVGLIDSGRMMCCDLLVGRGFGSFLVVMFIRCLMFDSIGRGSRFVG